MTAQQTSTDDQLREAFGEVGDALQRALVLSTERVQSVLEDAVVRGRMTRRDAEDLASNLVNSGREQAQALHTTLSKSIGDTIATATEAVSGVAAPLTKSGRSAASDRSTADRA